MNVRSTWISWALSAAAAALAATAALTAIGCGDDDGVTPGVDSGPEVDSGPVPDGGPTPDGGGGGGALTRPSRSSTVDVSEDDSTVVMVNTEDDSVTVFATADDSRRARVAVGDEPSSVVIHPDGTTAFVSLQGDATVVKITGLDGETPVVSAPVEVGSEPTGVALSPTGARLFVAEWAEGRISVIDTATMTVTGTIDNPTNPRALAVTNDGDDEDDDELLIVPEFFGDATAEASNTGRTGRVRIYQLSDLAPTMPILFEPIDSGFAPMDGAPTVMTSPNQLFGVAVQGQKIYVTSISASPQAPVRFNSNVFPVIHVGDLGTRTEDRSAVGTANLARLVADAAPAGSTKHHLADIVDLAFIGSSGIAYVISRGADVMQRVVYDGTAIAVGSDLNLQIDLNVTPEGSDRACRMPTGIATAHGAPRAYVNCLVTRNLGIVDLAMQALAKTADSVDLPTGAAADINDGRRFFFTGRGRWSSESWSTCGSCHPGGTTDNITWSFAAGPRQTTDLTGSYSHGSGTQQQRIFNWTGVFDEMHDFERNTRDTSGGLGVLTTSPTGMCGTLSAEVRDPEMLGGGLAQPIKELQDRPENCVRDWDDVDAFVRSLRPVRALRSLDAAAVARGAALFGMPTGEANNGGCVSCHGGAGFTASRRFWTPSTSTNMMLTTAPFIRPTAWPTSFGNTHTFQVAAQPLAEDPTGMPAAGPPQVACVIRDVNTFGIPGDTATTDMLEVRANGMRAQGAGGFNIPSLYSLALGAPYLHHGQAATLEELFTAPEWVTHMRAANAVFLTTGDVAQQRADLIAYLLSIDAGTTEQPLPAGFDGCPSSFP
jgi:YVTN family beta-propeller protein